MSIFDRFKKLGKKKGKENDEMEDDGEYNVAEFGSWRGEESEPVDENEIVNGEEYESDDGGVKVNYRGDLLNPSRKDKQEVYDRILKNTTNEELVEIDKSLKTSVTQYETFEDLEEKNISLMVLVALGFITEEDISGYRSYKEQGIDTTKFLTQEELTNPTDMDYAQEVFNASVKLPERHSGEVLDKQVEEPVYEPVEPDIDAEPEEIELAVKEPQEDGSQPVNNPVVEEDLTEEKVEPILGEEKNDEIEIGKPIPDGLSVLSRLKNIRVEQKAEKHEVGLGFEGKPPVIECETILPEVEELVVEEEKLRQVYVVAKSMKLPSIEGYQFHHVVTFDEIRKYTASKNNLLIITSDIPEELHDGFGDWLMGIAEDGDKYRMVTTVTDPVNHPNIEKEIDLTKDGLDDYFKEYTNDQYVRTESGSFADMELLWGK